MIPSEIESILRSHENVADASVFSITNNSGLDIFGCAWIILKDKSKQTDPEELRALSGRKVLDHIKFVDDFLMNENGKISKILMSKSFKSYLNISF